jgi:parallel beta-helix repeat protein
MRINFGSGDSGFTLYGMTGMGGSIGSGATNIIVRGSTFTGEVRISGTVPSSNIVFDGNSHNNIGGGPTCCRFLADGAVTIMNSHLEGGGSDGVRLGTSQPVQVLANTFLNIRADGSGNHTDMIQWYGGSNAVIRANLFKQTIGGETQVVAAYDSTSGNLIEDNVIDVTGRDWGIELYSDDGSIVRHNTVVNRSGTGFIDLNRKSQDDAGRNTHVYDNITTRVLLQSGSTAARRDHNMVRQNAGPGDFVGVPVFVGGANPTTYDGYRLAPGSPGKGAASDGLDVGARF